MTTHKTVDKGFTLIELLVVIAIIVVLATVVLLAINPAELLARGRDSTRLQDMSVLRKAIDATLASGSAVLPAGTDGATCEFSNTTCVSAVTTGARVTTGGGWLPMDISGFLPLLPVDPKQAGGTTMPTAFGGAPVTPRYKFASDGSSYRIATYLESRSNSAKLADDGGTLPAAFETGTDMTTTTMTLP